MTVEIMIWACIGFGLICIGILIGFILSSNYWKKYYNENNFYN